MSKASRRRARKTRRRRDATNATDSPATTTGTSGKYQAAQSSQQRPTPRISLKHEDRHLPQRDRDRLQTAAMDERRNYSVLGWSVRKHLDFVSTHSFLPATESPALNDDLAGLVEDWSAKEEFDERGRFSLQQHIRTDEACRTLTGDILLQKLTNGRIQAIEADRIRNPEKAGSDWKNGVRQNDAGRNVEFSVHRRTDNGFEFEQTLQEHEVYHFGYFTRHDQARGITELSSAINDFRDTSTAKAYALAKMKISQIFGVVMNVEDPSTEDINLNDGPYVAELGMDEKAEILSDKTPSTEFANFMNQVIAIAIKSLDLPFNFYDEAHTNFFGSKAAVVLYLLACKTKREQVQDLLKHLTRWRLNYEISRGRIRLPSSIAVARLKFHWIPAGVPWLDQAKEANAAEKLIELNLASRAEIRQATHGDDWFALTRRIAQEKKHLEQLGLMPIPPAIDDQAKSKPTNKAAAAAAAARIMRESESALCN